MPGPERAHTYFAGARVSESWSWHLEHLNASLCVRSNAYAYEMISDKYPMYSNVIIFYLQCNAI